jgi:hypothetical protein
MNKQHVQYAFADRREAERAFAAFVPIYLAARASRERKRRAQEAKAAQPNIRDSHSRLWMPRYRFITSLLCLTALLIP